MYITSIQTSICFILLWFFCFCSSCHIRYPIQGGMLRLTCFTISPTCKPFCGFLGSLFIWHPVLQATGIVTYNISKKMIRNMTIKFILTSNGDTCRDMILKLFAKLRQ